MELIEMFLKEIDSEAKTTRKMLERVPNDKFSWQPHPKSMTIKQLATHIAELPSWITIAITTDVLDFANNAYDPADINSREELLAYFEKNLAEGRALWAAGSEEALAPTWTMRNGKDIYMQMSKADVVRVSISQTIHHRAQLGVFLRLLNIPIPGSYGPSADEMAFEVLEQE